MSNAGLNSETFPKLFGYDIKGKQKEWSIRTIEYEKYSVIEIKYGYVGGKLVESTQNISSGKNIGKKNETTPFQQAFLEAQAKWKKKLEQGFTTKENNTTNDSNTSNNIIKNTTNTTIDIKDTTNKVTTQVYFPMLASDFNKFKHKIQYPVYIQPKLDGYRMIYNSVYKTCNSRQGKSFDAIHKTKLYKELSDINEIIVLDGELYKHGGIFEHLGILRKKKLVQTDYDKLDQIEYHVYDYIDDTKTYKQRYTFLQNFFNNHKFTKLKLVQTNQVHSETELREKHNDYVTQLYEGSIIRTTAGKYRCRARSQDLLKFKDFEDAEFPIVDFTFEQDTATNQNLIVWICKTQNGDTFNVRPKGTREERTELFKRGQEFIGQQLHVKYFELTDSGIPRFPTTKSESYTTYIRNIIE